MSSWDQTLRSLRVAKHEDLKKKKKKKEKSSALDQQHTAYLKMCKEF
jgi:hypothetical protein